MKYVFPQFYSKISFRIIFHVLCSDTKFMKSLLEKLCIFAGIRNLLTQPNKMVKRTQTFRRLLPTNCLSEFDHFMRLTLKGLILEKIKLKVVCRQHQPCMVNSKNQERIQNPVKHLRWSTHYWITKLLLFSSQSMERSAKIVLTIFAKQLILDVWQGS